MKKLFLTLSILFFAAAAIGFVAWSQDLLPGGGARGENWSEWSRAIDITWTIIQTALPASLVSAAIYLLLKPRSRTSLTIGITLLAIIVLATALLAFIMTHLQIQ